MIKIDHIKLMNDKKIYLTLQECGICLEDEFPIIFVDCQHNCCISCYRHMKQSMPQQYYYPLNCPFCRQPIQKIAIPDLVPVHNLKPILDSLEKFHKFYVNVKTRQRMFCHMTNQLNKLILSLVDHLEYRPNISQINQLTSLFTISHLDQTRLIIANKCNQENLSFRREQHSDRAIQQALWTLVLPTAINLEMVSDAQQALERWNFPYHQGSDEQLSTLNSKSKTKLASIDPIETMVTLVTDEEMNLLTYHFLVSDLEGLANCWQTMEENRLQKGITVKISYLLATEYLRSLEWKLKLEEPLTDSQIRLFKMNPNQLMNHWNELY